MISTANYAINISLHEIKHPKLTLFSIFRLDDKGMKLIDVTTEDVTVNGQGVSKTIANVMKLKYHVTRHVNVSDVKM